MDHLILEVGLALGLIAFAVWLAAKVRLSNVPFLILIGIIYLLPGKTKTRFRLSRRKSEEAQA